MRKSQSIWKEKNEKSELDEGILLRLYRLQWHTSLIPYCPQLKKELKSVRSQKINKHKVGKWIQYLKKPIKEFQTWIQEGYKVPRNYMNHMSKPGKKIIN